MAHLPPKDIRRSEKLGLTPTLEQEFPNDPLRIVPEVMRYRGKKTFVYTDTCEYCEHRNYFYSGCNIREFDGPRDKIVPKAKHPMTTAASMKCMYWTPRTITFANGKARVVRREQEREETEP